ncbi:MAG: AbrB family transcriptional regulator [Sulfurospirillaceae bacterium]|nr:AbrB family transcriptional regulator [Sulfurospirillaceae bacterium]
MKNIAKVLLTLFIALIGAVIFEYFKLPLPWLIGPIVIISIVVKLFPTLPMEEPKIFSSPAKAILGLTIGSAFVPAILNHLGSYMISLCIVVPFILVIAVGGTFYYWKFLGLDRMTAFFSAMPGGILVMVSIGEEMGANVYKVTLMQATRLLLVIFSLPLIIKHWAHIDLSSNVTFTPPLRDVSLVDLALLAILGIVGVWISKKWKISGGNLLIPMVLSAVFYFNGWIVSKPPDEIIKLVQIILGSSIGFSFYGAPIKDIIKTIVSTIGYFILLLSTCFLAIMLVHEITDIDLLSIILAFAPGGQAAINLIAIVVAANIPYVALHHVLRIFLVMAVSPIFAKKFKSEEII